MSNLLRNNGYENSPGVQYECLLPFFLHLLTGFSDYSFIYIGCLVVAHSSMELNTGGGGAYACGSWGRDGLTDHLMNICSMHFTWIKNGTPLHIPRA